MRETSLTSSWKCGKICSTVIPFSTSVFDSEFIPARTHPGRRLCIVLHGKGDRLDAYSGIQSELELFEFDFLLLNGPKKFAGGFKWMNDEPRHRTTLAMSRDLLFMLVEELKEFGYSTEDMLFLGHSQGGRVASDFVMHSPDVFLGLVAVSSYVGFFEGWADPVEDSHPCGAWETPWLFTHGTDDEIIKLSEIRNDIRELTRGKIPLTYREFSKGHDFDYDVEIPYIRNWVHTQVAIADAKRAKLALKTPSLPNEIGDSKIFETQG